MQPSEFMENLRGSGVVPLDNQLIADGMEDIATHSLIGPPPGAESVIDGVFSDAMPSACNNAKPQEPQQVATFDFPTTTLGMS